MPFEFGHVSSVSPWRDLFRVEDSRDRFPSNGSRLWISFENLTHTSCHFALGCNVLQVFAALCTHCGLGCVQIVQTGSWRDRQMENVRVSQFLIEPGDAFVEVSLLRILYGTFVLPLRTGHTNTLLVKFEQALKLNQRRKWTVGSSGHHWLSNSLFCLRVIKIELVPSFAQRFNSFGPIFVIPEMLADRWGESLS